MADEQAPVLSRTAFERLREELDRLSGEGRSGIAERLQRARELGDLSENAEYHATKDEQALMEARIRTLEHLIRRAKVVDGPVASETAIAGTVVTVRSPDDPGSEPEQYLLASSNEERAPDVRTVTVGSPLGQALNGARVGEVVKYQAPGGTFAYEILRIEPFGS